MPCNTLQVNVGGKNFQRLESNETGLLYFYFAQRVPLIREHYFYLFLSLMAEIGGYVGLILGYSLYNLAAVINTCIDVKIKAMEENERLENQRLEMMKKIGHDQIGLVVTLLDDNKNAIEQ